nr:carbon-nitrogen hydrolase family protein [Streptomyces flavidovirens]
MRIALNQMLSDSDPRRNLEIIEAGIAEAAGHQADLVVFPEAAMARFGTPLAAVAEPLKGPWAEAVRAMSARAGLTVVVGMFTPGDGGRVRNTLLITGPGVDTHYDKIHLFDALGYTESETVAPGRQPVTFQLNGLTFGVATCYDVRFPSLFHELAARGAQAILLPASWADGPGKADQWDVLVRARALDSGAWVLACDQASPRSIGRDPGTEPLGIGRSMAVSPSGEVRHQLDAAPGLLIVDLHTTELSASPRCVAGRRGA